MLKRRKLTLTATTCRLIENIRLALEVLFGARIRFRHLEFEKSLREGYGAFFVGDNEKRLMFIADAGREIYIHLKIGDMWYVARFDTLEQVRVSCGRPHPSWLPEDQSEEFIPDEQFYEKSISVDESGADWMWIVGTSFDNRHHEPPRPLDPIEYDATALS